MELNEFISACCIELPANGWKPRRLANLVVFDPPPNLVMRDGQHTDPFCALAHVRLGLTQSELERLEALPENETKFTYTIAAELLGLDKADLVHALHLMGHNDASVWQPLFAESLRT